MEVPEANGHVFNIGTGIATDVLTVAKTLCKHYGIDVLLNVSATTAWVISVTTMLIFRWLKRY